MKLKQLVFNSLPRSKSKQKKKQEQQQQERDRKLKVQQKLISHEASDVHSSCLYKSSRTSTQDTIPEEHTLSPAHRDVNQNHRALPLTSSTASSCRVSDKADVERASGVVKGNQEGRSISRHFNVNLNLSTDGSDTKCACYKHLKPLDSPDDFLLSAEAAEGRYYNLSSSSMEDSGFSSLPKTRTRIKTNPWLPSPRSTPSTSPDLSPMASSSSSPVYSDRRSFDSSDCHQPQPQQVSNVDRKSSSEKPRRDNIYEEITTLNIHPKNCLSRKFCDSFSARSTDSDSLLQRSLVSETDNTGTDILVTTDNNSASDRNSDVCNKYLKCCLDNNASMKVSHNASHEDQEEDQCSDTHRLDTHVSFDYEEAFESQLEANGVGQYVGSRDDLSEGSCEDLFNDPLGSRAHDFDSEYCPSNYDSSCNEYTSETETDDTVCDDYYTETGLRRGGRPAPFNDLFRDYYHYADDEEEKENSDDGLSLGSHTNLYQGRDDLTKDTCVDDDEGYGQGRTLGQVRLSLQEKVNRLRRDKLIVDKKIREAREEERLRMQEKMRFQKQMTLARKQLLLQTLQDLKVKLESQSERLQQTYTAVLSMQQAVISNRKQALHQQRPLLAIPNTREAPF